MVCVKYTRAFLHPLAARGVPFATNLITYHNVAFMQRLTAQIRAAIREQRLPDYVRESVRRHYPAGDVPEWVQEGCRLAGIDLGGVVVVGNCNGDTAAP